MKLGRNQKIGVASLAVPFTVATIFVFLGKMTAQEWIDLCKFLVPTLTGIVLVVGGAVKVLKKGEPE